MARQIVNFKLKFSRMETFSEEKYPVQAAANGVPFVDLPATGFYSGQHKGFTYSGVEAGPNNHMAQLEKSFVPPAEELFGEIPVMIDHSDSNRDKVGHMRSVHTEGNVSRVVLRVVGEEAIQGLREGKYCTLSAGIAHEEAPQSVFSRFVGECPECGENVEPDDDGVCPGCGNDIGELSQEQGEETQDEAELDDTESSGEEAATEGYARNNFSRSFRRKFVADTSKINVSYDHIAFTHRPYLTDCRIHDRSQNVMPVPKPKTVEIPSEVPVSGDRVTQEFAELRRQTEMLKADKARLEQEKQQAVLEANKSAERKLQAYIKTEELVKAGKVTPAEKPFVQAFTATLNDEQVAAWDAYMEVAAPKMEFDIKNFSEAIPPEQMTQALAWQRQQAAKAGHPSGFGGGTDEAELRRLAAYCTNADPNVPLFAKPGAK